MSDLWEGLSQAFWLVVLLDPDLVEITLRSLRVTLTALLIASLIALPMAALLAVRRFRMRRATIAVLNALMGLPPVVVGLIVYVFLSRSGPLGVFGLLFTPTAMIIAQVIIIVPLIASIAHQSLRELWSDYHDLLISMNTTQGQRIRALLWDGRRALLTAALAGFGRAIGEVGAIMVVGGNIDHATRVLTTAIALETGKGEFAMALGLGFVLIGMAIAVNLAIHWIGHTERGGALVMQMFPLTVEQGVVRRRGKVLVGPVDLTLEGQGTTIVVGPNGAGKTSLLKMLHGIVRLNEGRLNWACPREEAEKRQAFVFQMPVMMRRTVVENIAYPLRLIGVPGKEARARAADWARRIDLGDALERQAVLLSGGERQKLALARALIREPQVLFLDEPCASLDGRATREIEEILTEAAQSGTRLIMSTHNMGQAQRLADEVILVIGGRIHEFSPAAEFFAGPKTPQGAAFLRGDIVE